MSDRKLVVLDTSEGKGLLDRCALIQVLNSLAADKIGEEKIENKNIDSVVFRNKSIVVTYVDG